MTYMNKVLLIYTVITGDELPSAQWEHTFLMTEHGLEILSH